MEKLDFYPIGHAAWGNDVYGGDVEDVELVSIRNILFRSRVTINEIKIYPVTVRWVPPMVCQPEHVIIECRDKEKRDFIRIKEVSLPPFEDEKPHIIHLDGISTDNLRIICDKEHPIDPNHSEVWAGDKLVPFPILDNLEFYGEYIGEKYQPSYNPPLIKGAINPSSSVKVTATKIANEVYFESPYFKVGFSLRRPMILHLGWDDMGLGESSENLTFARSIWREDMAISGPVIQTVKESLDSQFYTGNVEVEGTTVIYRDVHVTDRYNIDYSFTINEKGMDISIEKRVTEDYEAYEHDDLRFVWDHEKSITGTLSVPFGKRGRTGTAPFPIIWNAPGHGCLEVTLKSGSTSTDIQTDTWKYKKMGWCGIDIGAVRDRYGFINVKKGTYRSDLSMSISPMLPQTTKKHIPAGLLRNWSTAFAFRTEFAGFSNNSNSVNCHLGQHIVAEILAYINDGTHKNMLTDMMEYTLELALRNGPGYSSRRDLYMDSDPSVLAATGVVYQLKRNKKWIRRMLPCIKEAFERIIENTDETGVMVSRTLSGNSGTKKWSSNGHDCLSVGHYDPYSTTIAYSALRHVSKIAKGIDENVLSEKAYIAAEKIKKNFSGIFTNPKTGLISGWVSEDGEHHDYAFAYTNYNAINYELVDEKQAVHIIDTFEDKMKEKDFTFFNYGIPMNLESIRNCDAPTGNDYKRDDGMDRFGIYINGSLSPGHMNHFVFALRKYGYTERLDNVCRDLLVSFENNIFSGGIGSGTEFHTWEGRPCGYEGVLVFNFAVLSSIAVHLGISEKIETQ